MNALLLFAQARGLDQMGRLSAIRKGFQETPSSSTQILAWALGAVALAGLFLMLLQMWRHRPQRGPKDDYLRQAIRILALSDADAQALRALARRSRWPHPTAMLLSPANLAAAVRAAESQRPDPKLLQDANRISTKLFSRELPAIADPEIVTNATLSDGFVAFDPLPIAHRKSLHQRT